MGKFKKAGRAGKTEKGDIVMVNEEGEATKVSEMTVLIWNVCEGKTEEQVTEFMLDRVKENKENAKKALKEIIGELVKVGMLVSEE